LPTRRHTGIFCALHEEPMEQGSAYAYAAIHTMWKQSLSLEFIVQKTYATEWHPQMPHLYANPTQCRDSVWHQTFAASFVDGRKRPVCNNDFKAALTRGKRSCQSGRTGTNYENASL
jgi:hypothetical protein